MKHLLITTIAALVLVGSAFADPIHDAAWDGDLADVQAELDKGADVNAKDEQGYTPLHNAAEGHKEIVELLIAKGADVNAKDESGGTPLLAAARYGRKEVAKLLITAGADVNAKRDNGHTPLDMAENEKTADLLRKHGGKTGAELKAEGK
jgi:ankyrin repeat protein